MQDSTEVQERRTEEVVAGRSEVQAHVEAAGENASDKECPI